MNTDTATAPVAVALVNWNGWTHVIECLDSLLAQDHPDFHVYVVDNDSSDGSVGHIAAWCAHPYRADTWRSLEGVGSWAQTRAGEPVTCAVVDAEPASAGVASRAVTIIRSGGNRGFAGGCNVALRAAQQAGFHLFWLLNSDTVVQRDALGALVRRLQARPEAGMAGSTLRYYGRPDTVEALCGARLQPDMSTRLIGLGSALSMVPKDGDTIEREMTYVTGASMLVTARFLQDVGFMQEDYFLYCEEIDWAMRARGRFRLAYAPDSHVFHKSGASSSKVMPLFSARFYYSSRIRFVGRFFPDRLWAARRGLIVELARHALRRRWGHARIVAATLLNSAALAAAAGHHVRARG